jgi:hypothetical protein
VIDQIDDQLIIRNVTKVVSEFLSENLPSSNPEIYLQPFLPDRVRKQISRPNSLKSSDLYCNLRVLIGNDRFFRDSNVFADATVNGCARIVLSYRNRIAHQNLGEIISVEHMQLEFIAVNRLVSLLPTAPDLQELVEQTRMYVGSALVYLAKEYFNSEISSSKKVEIHLRRVEGAASRDEVGYSEEIVERTDLRISISECKQLLRRLREQIQSEVDELPKWRNLLRESILDQIVLNRVCDQDKLKNSVTATQFKKTDPRQFVYFEKVSEIINRL